MLELVRVKVARGSDMTRKVPVTVAAIQRGRLQTQGGDA